jgi:hypothetical protein
MQYYSTTLDRVFSASQMQALFAINVETMDITILNGRGFYPVTPSPNPYDTYLYSATPVYNIVGTDAVEGWVATPLPLADAKAGASWELLVQGNQAVESSACDCGFSSELLTAVASQDPLLRPARYQHALDEMTAISDQLDANLTAIDAATSVDEIDSIVHQPSGTLVVGRDGAGPDDMTPAYFTDLTNMPPGVGEPELEIYIPGTDTVIPYDAGLPDPYRFDSAGNCYNTGDYRTTIRVAATGQVLSTVTPAAGPAVPIAWTYNPTIPPAPGGGSSEAF